MRAYWPDGHPVCSSWSGLELEQSDLPQLHQKAHEPLCRKKHRGRGWRALKLPVQ